MKRLTRQTLENSAQVKRAAFDIFGDLVDRQSRLKISRDEIFGGFDLITTNGALGLLALSLVLDFWFELSRPMRVAYWLVTLAAAAQSLLNATGYEGFVPLERRRLRKRGEKVDRLVDWFAEQRHLDSQPLEIDFPSLGESAAQARRAVRSGAGTATGAIGVGLGKLRRGENGGDQLTSD